MKNGQLLLILLLAPTLWAQGPRLKEAQETLRFIRLAETRKNLDLDETKLLQLNEILDGYEATRIEIKAREATLIHSLKKEKGSEDQNNHILDDYVSVRKSQLENEIKLIADVRNLLTPSEAVSFFIFYERFQQDVQRRIRSIQQDRRGDRPMKGRLRNP